MLGMASLLTAAFGRELAAQTQSIPSSQTKPAPPSGKMPIRLTVNGATHDLVLDPRTSLLDALRDQLALTGTKKGCDHGQCGACTVLVNDQRFNACLSLDVAR